MTRAGGPLFLGIDAGGSKTVCLVGDRKATLGRGESGPANPNIGGIAGFRAAVAGATAEALADAARQDGAVSAEGRPKSVWIGVAGGDSPAAREALRAAALEELDGATVTVSHDGRLLLAAAGVHSGIAVVSGTGSSVYGRSVSGAEVKAGGWGHLLGDEGSGYDIARAALRAVTRAADGRGPHTKLSEAIARSLGVDSVDALRERLYPAPTVPEIASLARTVLELAPGDEIAAAIVKVAAGELALAVFACRRELERANGAAEDGQAELPVVAAGGLLGTGSPLLDKLAIELEREGCVLLPLTSEPAAGALALARDGSPTENEEAEEEAWRRVDR